MNSIGHISLRERRYDSGLVEVGVYTPQILRGAGDILVAVVCSVPGTRKWSVTGPGGWGSRHLLRGKRAALAYAAMLARDTDSYRTWEARQRRVDPLDRSHPGSLYQRGENDSYYRRRRQPHYGDVLMAFGAIPRVDVTDAAMVAEYEAGYDANERDGNHKDWE